MTGTQEPRMTTAPNEPPPEGSSGPQSASEAATAAQDVQAATDAAEGHTAAPALTAVDGEPEAEGGGCALPSFMACDCNHVDSCQHPAPEPGLREQYAAAIYEQNNPGMRWADAHPDDLLAYAADADAVLGVRDQELQQLRAKADRLEPAIIEQERLADELADAKRRVGNLRSSYATLTEMARGWTERGIENGKRAEQAEAANARLLALLGEAVDPELQQLREQVARVHAYLIRLCAEPHPSHDHVCPDDVRRDVLTALDQPQEQLQDPS